MLTFIFCYNGKRWNDNLNMNILRNCTAQILRNGKTLDPKRRPTKNYQVDKNGLHI